MIAMDRGRRIRRIGFALATCGALGGTTSMAQPPTRPGQAPPARTKPAAAATPAPSAAYQADTGGLSMVRVPVNPTDAIAVINGEAVTRQQLADECVARKGEEILETLVARKLIEQALREKKLEVTASEVDREIDAVAMKMAGVGREAWLRTLSKERGISPFQYARDIIYPALALRKLASPRVEVTERDQTDAFEAQYGDKLRCRIIMVDKLRTAQEIWEELKKNPGGFEKLAQDRSMDSGSRSLGGLLAAPITRHAYPQNVSNAAFAQLVDGDPKDKDPAHKPKDGDFTGPIQVAEATWVVIRREGVLPAQRIDPKNPQVQQGVHEMIFDVKLKEKMNEVFSELMHKATIDNKLTGQVKTANEDAPSDNDLKLSAHAEGSGQPQPRPQPGATPGAAGSRAKLPPPAAASPEVINQAESLIKPPTARP
jgi:parvulin-like peptidyl-prolyl isomerase